MEKLIINNMQDGSDTTLIHAGWLGVRKQGILKTMQELCTESSRKLKTCSFIS